MTARPPSSHLSIWSPATHLGWLGRKVPPVADCVPLELAPHVAVLGDRQHDSIDSEDRASALLSLEPTARKTTWRPAPPVNPMVQLLLDAHDGNLDLGGSSVRLPGGTTVDLFSALPRSGSPPTTAQSRPPSHRRQPTTPTTTAPRGNGRSGRHTTRWYCHFG